MFLSVKELELRKIRFDETYQPGGSILRVKIWSKVLPCA